MSIIDEKSNLVAGDIERKVTKDIAFDVLTILAIAQIVIAVVKLFMVCMESPIRAKQVMGKPSWLQNIRLRRIIRNTLKNKHFLSRIKFHN